MRRYFLIDKNNIEAVEGFRRAQSKAIATGCLFVGCPNDLARFNMATLVAVHNKVADKPIERFEDKRTAVRRTWDALTARFGVAKEPTKDIRTGPGIHLLPGPTIKPPGPDTKRALVLSLISRPDGATHDEIHEAIGRGRNHVRVFLQDLNRRCGYGIRTVQRGPYNTYFLWKGD